MRKHFEMEIQALTKELLSVGGLVEEAIHNSVASLFDRDQKAFKAVQTSDKEIDERELKIEEACLKVMALYNPVASDLRFIISVVKINNDLERMGDLAVNIAERAEMLYAKPPIDPPPLLDGFAKHVLKMVRGALDSFVNEDASMALSITRLDDVADRMHRDIFEWLQKAMVEAPDKIDRLLPMQSVSRSLERIADHATNIAEDVYYLVWGDIIRHHVRDFDKGEAKPGT